MSQFEELREKFAAFVYHGYHVEITETAQGNHAASADGAGASVGAASQEAGMSEAGAVSGMTGAAEAGMADVSGAVNRKICRIVYDFEIPGLSEFHPTWTFPIRRRMDDNAMTVLSELIFQLGMTETISYYKITCPRTVVIECGCLTKEQQSWWRHLYHNGLGEFMYRNGIEVSEEDLVRFECPTPEERSLSRPLRDDSHYEGFLVPVGGGKDSVVTLETLRGQDIMTYHIGDDSAIDEVIEVFHGNTRIRRRPRYDGAAAEGPLHRTVIGTSLPAAAVPKESSAVGGPRDVKAHRTLDPNMLELNRQGYLNGHTPFSAIVAFSSVIAAFLNGRSQIALSNESSANETTVPGSFVNHQYSKSYEFEEDFQNYLGQIVTSDIHYYSFLRPLSEIQIAGLFADCRAYHPVFLSCNRGSRKGIWCGNCPKCLFVYIILSPFLSEEELIGIFGEKLLDRPSLEKNFRELTGLDENKPFECVGTRGEVAVALKDYVCRGGSSYLTDRYKEEILAFPDELTGYLCQWNENHVPEPYAEILREKVGQLNR